MKRVVISPQKRLGHNLPNSNDGDNAKQQQQVHSRQNAPNNSKRAVVASLPVDRSRPAHPYSSLALSPKGRYALVAGKGTIQLVAVAPEGLRTLRSLKIAHHFFNTSATTSSPSSGATNRHGDVRDAFSLAAETRASAVTAGVANMNLNQQYGNIIVTKVAWSNNFFYSAKKMSSQRNGAVAVVGSGTSLVGDIGMDESSRSLSSIMASESYETGSIYHSKGKRKSSRFQDPKSLNDDDDGDNFAASDESMKEDDSLVAAAGSNGVVVVWSAKKLFFSDFGIPPAAKAGGGFISTNTKSSAAFLAKNQRSQQPEGILNQHTRAVNCMAWHPTRSGLLLTASQDGTIKLWERRVLARPEPNEEGGDKKSHEASQNPHQQRSWFSMVGDVVGGGVRDGGRGVPMMEDDDARKYTWGCRATFSLGEQDAVRDIRWNSLIPELFGAVTSNGNLVVYNIHVVVKALVKIAAHTGDAASLDWHPRWPFVVATGGSSDRFVKIWDLESSLDSIVNVPNHPPKEGHHFPRKEVQQQNQRDNSNTMDTAKSDNSSHSASSNETLHSSIGISSVSSNGPSIRETILRNTSSGWTSGATGRNNKSSSFSKHVLSISASVTQVRWRPPSNDFVPSSPTAANGNHDNRNNPNKEDTIIDRHDTMLAVVTARQTSAGGSGTLSLWSFHRPFMSLSIVEGHEEGAISDFVWVKTPQIVPKASYGSFEFKQEKQRPNSKRLHPEVSMSSRSNSARLRKMGGVSMMDESAGEARERNYFRDDEQIGESLHVSYIWQNVLSVGRDGQCIMQSFARGERRIRSVPSSCFTMANLSPFQQGYGSLQFFSVYQDVPNRAEDDFMLTGLRQDEHTAKAPGIFFEEDLHKLDVAKKKEKEEQGFANRFPGSVPELRFTVIDQGSLDPNGMPIVGDEDALCIAPEVLHMSRFARLYKLYPDEKCHTRADLCLYNSKVAEELKCWPLARMWKSVSSLLRASGLEELTAIDPSKPTNAFQFVIFRTVKSLLFERAEAGDVQTNVALCEVLQVVDTSGEQTRIPGLSIKLVREWYLYYIDLLHQMCLFSAAAFLIKHCNDPAIGALSQQSTTIHESCPRCGKPLDSSADSGISDNSARQVCKNCRRRVAMCFICHEPVTGMFVWCPGCGHGGHLEHALQWFGGLNGKAVRTVCPTGCGHKCNLVQMATAFPRTMSMTLSDSSSMENILSVRGHQPRCIPANMPLSNQG